MKLPTFQYNAPGTLEEALELLEEHGDEARILAGGQSLVPMLAMRLARPTQLIDINGLSALAGIDDRGDVLAFGAMSRERDVERSRVVTERTPVLAEALPFIGHVSIRNRGTIGGSIAHADAAAELPAVAMVTEAEIVARSHRGERVIPADNFFVSHYTTALADDECLVELRVPTTPPGAGWSFQEVTRRHGDFALVGVAAMVTLGADRAIDGARICLFGVADRPLRAPTVEAALVGSPTTADTFAAAANDAVKDLKPAGDVHGSAAYRRHVAGVSVRRALTVAAQRAGAPT